METIVHKLVGIHKLWHAGNLSYAIISIVRDCCLLCLVCTLASLGGNHDDTSRGTATIDSCRRCILEDIDTVDIVRVEEVHVVANYTIDNIQWLSLLVDRSLSTYLDVESCTCPAARLCNVDTRYATLQRLGKVRGTTSGNLVGVDRCNRTCYVTLAHRTVTNDNDLVESRIIVFEDNVPRLLPSHFNFLWFAADVAERKNCVWFCVLNAKLTVEIGNATSLAILVGNGNTNHRLTIGILDGTLDCFLRKCSETN